MAASAGEAVNGVASNADLAAAVGSAVPPRSLAAPQAMPSSSDATATATGTSTRWALRKRSTARPSRVCTLLGDQAGDPGGVQIAEGAVRVARGPDVHHVGRGRVERAGRAGAEG